MPKVFVVQNPVAGTQSSKTVTQKIESFFTRVNVEYQHHFTEKDEDIPKLVSSAIQKGFDLFIAAGGDGTVSAVATGMANHPIPMGILPIGTGNGLARNLRIPLNVNQALGLIHDAPAVRSIDAIEVKGRYHLLNLSAGITPMALEKTEREQKRRLGRMAYILAGFRSLVGIQPITFFLEIDGEKFNIKASEVLLINSVNVGDPAQYLNLGIENDDGQLDLFVLQSKTISDYVRVFFNLILRRTNLDPDVKRFNVQDKLIIAGRRYLEVQADGDLIGYTPMEAKLVPKAVNIIVPG